MTNESKCKYWETLSSQGYASLYNAKPEQYSGKGLDELPDDLMRNDEGKYKIAVYDMPPEQIDLLTKIKIEQHLKIIKIVLCAGFAISIIGGIILAVILAP